ncbi:Werner Syndrome-like exonuclease [Rhynchospora pubera]|uniref:3'-5' exonuclease n=1 Tax=Rhynchospora pubera TaxID=906938 RepID=A0AAV8C2I8_9POAL|nr:Werner Syndrome-like exonuclease [Rhynchospora pubera]
MRDSTLEKIYAGHIPLHRSNFMMENDFLRDIAPTPRRVHLAQKFEVFKFGGRIAYCRTASEVEKATVELLNKIEARNSTSQVPLGFDVEWKPSFKKGATQAKTAVIQICLDTTYCYVMHIFHSGIPSILKSLLEDSSSMKVGVGVQADATKLVKDYDVNVQSLIDLSWHY